jgi:hypothetical protein
MKPIIAYQSMIIMQGRISSKFQDLPERQLGLRKSHGLFGDLGKSYSRVIAVDESMHISSDLHRVKLRRR